MLNYKEELIKKRNKVKEELKAHENCFASIKFGTDEWWRYHKKINSLKIDLKTASDRIEYLEKPMGIQPVKLIE